MPWQRGSERVILAVAIGVLAVAAPECVAAASHRETWRAASGSVSAPSQSALEVFERNAKGIARSGITVCDGFCFSSASWTVKGTSQNARAAATDAAMTAADAQFLALALDCAQDCPKSMPEALRSGVERAASLRTIRTLHLRGIETVEKREESGKVAVVRAIAQSAIPKEKITWPSALKLLRSAPESLVEAGLISQISMLETGNAESARAEFVRALVQAKERNPSRAPSLGLGRGFSDSWLQRPRPWDSAELQALSDESLERLLITRPGDPDVIAESARRLAKLGLAIASEAIASSPKVRWEADRDASVECADALMRAIRVPLDPDADLAEMARRDKEESVLAAHVDAVRLVVSTGSSWWHDPTGIASAESVRLFDAKQFPAALRLLLQEFRKNPSADTLSLMSASLLRCDAARPAKTLAMIAYAWSPGHRFAGANVLRAMMALGQLDDARAFAGELRKRDDLSEDARSKVDELLPPEQDGAGTGGNATTAPVSADSISAERRPTDGELPNQAQELLGSFKPPFSRAALVEDGSDVIAVAFGSGMCAASDAKGVLLPESIRRVRAMRAAVIDAKAKIAETLNRSISAFSKLTSADDGSDKLRSRVVTTVKRTMLGSIRMWKVAYEEKDGVLWAYAWLHTESSRWINGAKRGALPVFVSEQDAIESFMSLAKRGLCDEGTYWVAVGGQAAARPPSIHLIGVAFAFGASPYSGCSRKLDALAAELRDWISRRRELEVNSIADPLTPDGNLRICVEEQFSTVTLAEASTGARVGGLKRESLSDGAWVAVGSIELVP